MSATQSSAAIAHPNIALIKYWGKSNERVHNEPAVASLSITLDSLSTQTSVAFDPALDRDTLRFNGDDNTEYLSRISRNIDRLRQLANSDTRCRIVTENNFPTAAGLASSASGYAALVVACNDALSLNLDLIQQSQLARAMSGSASRSIRGGFVKIERRQGDIDPHFGVTYAEQFATPDHWALEVCVAIISENKKPIGSTEGMELTRQTSPYYNAWLDGNDQDVANAEAIIRAKDFAHLAELSEFSCMKMHSLAMASRPGVLYWSGATVDGIHAIRALRASGIPVFFTIDAGPQIKAICEPGYGEMVAEVLADIVGVKRVIRCGLGGDARVMNR